MQAQAPKSDGLSSNRQTPCSKRGMARTCFLQQDESAHARWTADHRLLLGGADRRIRLGQRRYEQFTRASTELRSYFESRLPALASVETPLAWEGVFAMTPDSLPYIGPHNRYPRHWFALGYGGNGMRFGSLAARLLLERWHGSRSSDHDLFAFDRLRRASCRIFDRSIVEFTAYRPC